MKVSKAIEILERECGMSQGLTLKEILEAEQLGLEALKYVKDTRGTSRGSFSTLLSGETPEEET